MKTHARVIVIGGAGKNIVYCLTKNGWFDVVLTADPHGGTPVF